MKLTQRAAALLSIVVLLIAGVVYFRTLTPTVPFWDSGEFIAVSYILGIPHPPGTPFFVLLGRIATLVPWATVAQRVNAVSAVAAALAVMVTYLSLLRLIRKAQGENRQPWQDWVAVAGAFTGALMLAFSDSFWGNSVEAEVYQLMSLAQILVFWLGLKWWDTHDRQPNVGLLLVATYVMWLCVGLHLGVGIMGLPLIVLVALVDWKVAVLFAMPFLALLRVPAGLEKMAGAVIVLSAITNFHLAWRKKLPGWVPFVALAAAAPGLHAASTDANFSMTTAVLTAIGVIGPMAFLARTHREGRVLLLALFLMIAGYSTHLYLPIRAAQHPAVNEGAPATWDKMRDLLERKQYGEMNPMVRRGKFVQTQLDKEFWRYFRRQWPLFQTHQLWGAILPILLGLLGGWWQYRREKKSFLFTFSFLGLSTAGMIFFLNFSDHEVRERDYFFQSGFHAYSLWIGLGVAWLVQWVRESFSAERAKEYATIATAALLAIQPFLLLKNLWFTHDRSHNFIARDYAYNMLAPLAPNSFMFTNGDNDTFPLWYLQQVEGVRKDVRIVNLSLLNTDWYIRQLRDEEPKVPIELDDHTVDMLGMGAIQDDRGNIIYTNEYMVHHIMEHAKQGDGWKKQPYFAVTVPEHYGYDPYFSLEGLVYNVKTDSMKAGLDVAATNKALYETFRYRGLFLPDGSWDPKVYKDDNASTLSRNYAAAHLQLAFYYRRARQLDKAISEMERIGRMFPAYAEVLLPLASFYMDEGDTTRAMELYDRLAKQAPNSPEARYYHGAALAYRGNAAAGLAEFDVAIALDPDYYPPFYGAFTALWDTGQRERALGYMQRWVDAHPNDANAQGMLQQARAALSGGAPPPPVRPPTLNLP